TPDRRAAQASRSEKRHLGHVNLPLESIAVRRPRLIKLSRFRVFVFLWLIVLAAHGLHANAPPKPFVWAGDPQGGAPFVEADPAKPNDLVGFDVEIAALMARGLGRTPQFINIEFTSIDQSIARG